MAAIVLRDRDTLHERRIWTAFPDQYESVGDGTFWDHAEEAILPEAASTVRRLKVIGRDGSARWFDDKTAAPRELNIDGGISREFAAQLREKIVATEPRTLRPWISVADATAIAGFRNELELRQLFSQRRLANVRRRNDDGSLSDGTFLGSLARLLRADPPQWTDSSAVGSPMQTVSDEQARAAGANGQPVLYGHAAVFNQWTEIDSFFEGRFLERMLPGAFENSIRLDRGNMRCLLAHGLDPQVAQKPLGPIEVLREDSEGVYYEVPLLDTSYNKDLIPGLRAGVYGSSFRFQVILEDLHESPGRSAYNPEGLPEVTVREVQLKEFGPVAFPAYKKATAAVRSGAAA